MSKNVNILAIEPILVTRVAMDGLCVLRATDQIMKSQG